VIENIDRICEKQDADHAHCGANGPQQYSRPFHAVCVPYFPVGNNYDLRLVPGGARWTGDAANQD